MEFPHFFLLCNVFLEYKAIVVSRASMCSWLSHIVVVLEVIFQKKPANQDEQARNVRILSAIRILPLRYPVFKDRHQVLTRRTKELVEEWNDSLIS